MAITTASFLLTGLAATDAQAPWDWDHYLRPEWDTVTPGAVSGPPTAVRLGAQQWGLAILTEDRHLRVYDATGVLYGTVRTGVRSASAIASEPGGTLLLAGEGRRIVRLHPAGGGVTVIRTMAAPVQRLWSDPAGNAYVIDSNHEIHHISAAGTPLWSRYLAAGIGATAVTDHALLVGGTGGELLRFDQQGSGTVIFRSEGGITDVLVRSGVRRDYVVIRDDTGNVSALEYGRSGAATGARRLWRIDSHRQDLLGIDGGENLWMIAPGGVITSVDNRGMLRPTMRIEGLDRSRAALAAYPGRVYAIDGDLRLRTVSVEGRVESAVQLRRIPGSVQFVPHINQLVALYPDWTLQVYSSRTTTPLSAAPVRDAGGTFHPTAPILSASPGALRAFADTVFHGSSRAERERLVAILRERVGRRNLYGAVADYRSAAIDLLQEEGSTAETRRAAVDLLAALLDRPSREALRFAAINDPDLSVAAAAATALTEFGVTEYPFLQQLHQRYLRTATHGRVQLASALVAALERYPAAPGSAAVRRRKQMVVEIAATLGTAPEFDELRRRLVEIGRRENG